MDIDYNRFMDYDPKVQAHIRKRVNEIIVANQAAFEAIAKIVVKATSEAKAKAEAEARAKAEAEAETKARLQSLQKVAYKVISNCFPSLTSLAQEQVALIDNPEYLDDLIDQLLALPNEATMRKELHLPPLLRCQSS